MLDNSLSREKAPNGDVFETKVRPIGRHPNAEQLPNAHCLEVFIAFARDKNRRLHLPWNRSEFVGLHKEFIACARDKKRRSSSRPSYIGRIGSSNISSRNSKHTII